MHSDTGHRVHSMNLVLLSTLSDTGHGVHSVTWVCGVHSVIQVMECIQ